MSHFRFFSLLPALTFLLFSPSNVAWSMGAPKNPPGMPEEEVLVPGAKRTIARFDAKRDTLAFRNFLKTPGSSTPKFIEFKHCTSLVLMVRQFHNFARFNPEAPKVSPSEYEGLIRQVYRVPTGTSPEGFERIEIPGYSGLFEFSSDKTMELYLKTAMGAAYKDVFRKGFGWLPYNVLLTKSQQDKIERQIRFYLDQNKPVMIYLTNGTKQAHAVLVLGYRVNSDLKTVTYSAYDPNLPGRSVRLEYDFSESKLHYVGAGSFSVNDRRNAWILHAY